MAESAAPESIAQESIALYVHWPFCLSKCPYCDFNSHVREAVDEDAWARAYAKEWAYFRQLCGPRPIHSIFFGGGTPSLMPPRIVEQIIEKAAKECGLTDDCEITLEANPTSSEAGKFRDFAAAGVNRLSLGVQALDDAALQFLGREHKANQALAALEMAQKTFSRTTFDLIYARPGQTVEQWRQELSRALNLAQGHISLYILTIEPGTAFYHRYHHQKAFTLPDEEQSAQMYELTLEMTTKAGLQAYEVSNYAAPGLESRHNLTYWRYRPYWGMGPGAHSRLYDAAGNWQAVQTLRSPEAWMEQVQNQGHGIESIATVGAQETFEEWVMMGLRMREGLTELAAQQRFARSLSALFSADKIQLLEENGLLTRDENALKATQKGWLVLSALTAQLLTYSG